MLKVINSFSFFFQQEITTLTVTSLCGQKHVRDKPEPGPLDRMLIIFWISGREGGSGFRCFFFALCTYVKFALSAKCKVQRPKCKSPSCFSFYALAVKRTVCARRRLGRYPILRLTSSLRCARGGAAAGWIEKAQSAERLQACRGARCSFSDRAAGGVSAGWRGEA